MEPTVKVKSNAQTDKIKEFKVVLVGDTKVGKTTIIQSLTGTGSIGRGYSVSLLSREHNGVNIVGRIYDLRSQRYFPFLHSLYYHGAKGAIIVFDITDRESFDSIKKWRDIIWGHVGNVPILLCGNKSDLRQDKRNHATIDEIKKLMKQLSKTYKTAIHYLEISAQKNIIAICEIEDTSSDGFEDIYPTTEAFRKPFINWLIEIIKKG